MSTINNIELIDAALDKKLNKLISILKEKSALAIAFSGGVDSTFLLKVAHDVLKDRVIALTAKLPIHSEWEFQESIDFTKSLSIRHIIIKSDSIDIEGFSQNPENRCYLCKRRFLGNSGKLQLKMVLNILLMVQILMTLKIIGRECLH